MDKDEALFGRNVHGVTENLLAERAEAVTVEVAYGFGEGERAELTDHAAFHLGGGVVGERDREDVPVAVARGTDERAAVGQAQEAPDIRSEAGGEVVEHQIVGFPGAGGGGIDGEH